jgi:hypothetical protein
MNEADMREEKQRYASTNRVRGTLLGAALVAFGVIAVSAYSFAAGGDQPSPAPVQNVSSGAIRTTPDNADQPDMPPPVAPSKTE